jgi:hypothetical protein
VCLAQASWKARGAKASVSTTTTTTTLICCVLTLDRGACATDFAHQCLKKAVGEILLIACLGNSLLCAEGVRLESRQCEGAEMDFRPGSLSAPNEYF